MTTETLAERLAKCVKPLKWTPRSDGRQWYGNSPRGLYLSYTAVMGQETGEWSCYLRDFWRPFPTLEAAKAAAQADYTARILAALDMDALAQEVEAMVGEAFVDGAMAVHNEWVRAHGAGEAPPRVADFSEAADDYVAAAIRASEGGKP